MLSPSEVDLLSFPFVFGGYALACWCWGGGEWISPQMRVYATLALDTWLLLGHSARSSAAPPAFSVISES